MISFSGYQFPSEVRARGDVSVNKAPQHLVFEAHRWLYHSTLGSRVIKKKKYLRAGLSAVNLSRYQQMSDKGLIRLISCGLRHLVPCASPRASQARACAPPPPRRARPAPGDTPTHSHTHTHTFTRGSSSTCSRGAIREARHGRRRKPWRSVTLVLIIGVSCL